jgi:hypothetical protein
MDNVISPIILSILDQFFFEQLGDKLSSNAIMDNVIRQIMALV